MHSELCAGRHPGRITCGLILDEQIMHKAGM